MADKKKKKTNIKPKRTSSEKKPEKSLKAKKPAVNKLAAKKSTETAVSKQRKKTEKKLAVEKQTKKIKALKPDINYENSTSGDEKIIVLGGKKARKQSKSGRKKLKRVANSVGFTAWDGRTGKTFATEKEAREYAIDFFSRTGELIAVTRTQRTISHTFKAESTSEK